MSKKHDGYKDGLVEDYVSDFDLYNNDTSNVYTPTAYERAMITEAMHGFVANHWPGVWEIRAAALEEAARVADTEADFWRESSGLPPRERGVPLRAAEAIARNIRDLKGGER
jgi:hypothetical protein